MTDERPLKAPFPWFGGKSRSAHLVWPRFGDVSNYIEPFAGSLAMLLLRPKDWPARVETVNDKDAYLANFWRALQADPETVAYYADSPVNEVDLHARHLWLVKTANRRLRRLLHRPDYYDPKVAGWWVYGQCLWIGSGWCAAPDWTGHRGGFNARQSRGVHTDEYQQRPSLTQKLPKMDRQTPHREILAKRPEMKRGGRVVHSHGRRFQLGGQGGGSGVHAPTLTQQLPQLSGDQSGAQRGFLSESVRSEGIYDYMERLATRLRRVRVCCGDWSRIVTPSVTTYIGLTGVFLDPPYDQSRRSICYTQDHDISHDVRAWCLANGDNPKMRIALCGYQGEHDVLETHGWSVVGWRAGGGYGRSKRGVANRTQERIWFSPACLKTEQIDLFSTAFD